jgi:hypothetical protein
VTNGHGVEAGTSIILSDPIALSSSDIIFTPFNAQPHKQP